MVFDIVSELPGRLRLRCGRYLFTEEEARGVAYQIMGLDGVRAATFKPLIQCLKSIDQDLLKGAVAGAKFSELFFASCKDEELAAYVKTLL